MKNYNKNYLLLLAVIFLILSCNINSRSQKLIDADSFFYSGVLDL